MHEWVEEYKNNYFAQIPITPPAGSQLLKQSEDVLLTSFAQELINILKTKPLYHMYFPFGPKRRDPYFRECGMHLHYARMYLLALKLKGTELGKSLWDKYFYRVGDVLDAHPIRSWGPRRAWSIFPVCPEHDAVKVASEILNRSIRSIVDEIKEEVLKELEAREYKAEADLIRRGGTPHLPPGELPDRYLPAQGYRVYYEIEDLYSPIMYYVGG